MTSLRTCRNFSLMLLVASHHRVRFAPVSSVNTMAPYPNTRPIVILEALREQLRAVVVVVLMLYVYAHQLGWRLRDVRRAWSEDVV